MRLDTVIRIGIIIWTLCYFAFLRTDVFLLDILNLYLLVSNIISLFISFWIAPEPGTIDLHQQILLEEQAWWASRKEDR